MAPAMPIKAAEPTFKKPPDKASDSKAWKKSNRVSGLLSKIIQIRVGDRQEPFQVHKDVLGASSPFFRNACKGPWKESMHDWIELPEDDPEIFEVYLQWLYLKTVEITAGQDAPQHFAMYESYKFGDKILDTAFKNAVIDHLIRSVVTNQVYPTYLAKAVYQNLPASSGLRRLYVDFWAWASCVEWYDGGAAGIEEAPLEFFSELSRKQTEIKDKRSVRKEKFPWVIDACQYHEHAEGSPKCSNKPNK